MVEQRTSGSRERDPEQIWSSLDRVMDHACFAGGRLSEVWMILRSRDGTRERALSSGSLGLRLYINEIYSRSNLDDAYACGSLNPRINGCGFARVLPVGVAHQDLIRTHDDDPTGHRHHDAKARRGCGVGTDRPDDTARPRDRESDFRGRAGAPRCAVPGAAPTAPCEDRRDRCASPDPGGRVRDVVSVRDVGRRVAYHVTSMGQYALCTLHYRTA